ncbi:protein DETOXIFICATION 49-like [Magnolia sinica]|uniref:protein DETOXIFICATION 49-like n=1 Tax=Magnolia sinica TaxID=86752 RepID=UPI00265A2DE4|nr:protein DETOXIFICATION 49-like [Magnolia sinica]
MCLCSSLPTTPTMCLCSSLPSNSIPNGGDKVPILIKENGPDDSPAAPLLCSESNNCLNKCLSAKVEKISISSKEDRQESPQESPLYLEIVEELKALSRISAPATIAGLLFYVRNLVSMLFLGRLGEVELAAGSLAVGFANITGYSIIFGLAMGMEPICGQAYGARKWTLLSLTLHRTVVILLFTCLPISLLWLNVDQILLYLGQDPTITKVAHTYLLYCLPDLIAQAFVHPLRIYLRTQNITRPIAISSILVSLIHIPINYFLVITLGLGIKGVAMGVALSNFNLVLFLICSIFLSEAHQKTWTRLSLECMREWRSYLSLAVPSCISICLEWWWYEFMIIVCGLFGNPKDTVAAIGILIQATSLIYVFPSSLSYGVSTRVAHELGARRPHGARRAAAVGTICGAFMGVLAMGFAVWARGWWGHMFTSGPGVLKLTVAALPIVGLCELGNCPQTTMCGVLRGSARADLGAHVNLGGFYGVGLPLALGLGFGVGLGFVGLWLGLLGAQISCAVVLGVVLFRTDWGAQVKRAEEITGVGMVVEEYDEGDDVKKVCVMDGGDEEKGAVDT